MDQVITTRKLPLEDIIKLIDDGDEEQFVGLEETADFEFKEFSYKTTSPGDDKHKAHMELAKDITAIANAVGGLLCIGLKPDQKFSVNVEYVKAISGVEETDINMQSWSAILSDWIIPRFSVSYLKYGFMGKSKKIFWIQIPNAKEIGQYPFIIAKDQYSPEKDLTVKGRVFGCYTRDGAQVLPLAPDKLQKYIADGLKAESEYPTTSKNNSQLSTDVQTLSLKVDSLSSQLANLPIILSPQEVDYDQMEKRVAEYANTRIGGEYGYFYLYAIPKKKQEIKNFWNKDEGSISHSLKHTPIIRNMGWSLEVADSEYPYIKGDSWEIMNGNRKILFVTKKGEIFAAGAIDGFLDWSMENDEQPEGEKNEVKLVNAFAFTEYVDIFFRFLMKLKKDFNLNTEYIVKAGFEIPEGIKLAMQRSAHLGPWSLFSSTSKSIMQQSWTFSIDAEDTRSPSAIAADVVIEINATGFGWPAQKEYPYLKEGVNGYEVDEDLYRKNVTV